MDDRGSAKYPGLSESAGLYQDGRKAMASGEFENALKLFQESLRLYVHFKTLELMGECCMRLGRFEEALVPLAAASTLNRGARAPALLAEAFLQMERFHEAASTADIAVSRQPHNGRLLAIRDEAHRRAQEELAEKGIDHPDPHNAD